MATAAKRPGADLDYWCWQLQALEDVTQFVRRHGPASASPLPVVPWRLGHTRNVVAELPSYQDDALDVLRAFGKVLGAAVQERDLDDRITYFVTGRVGRKDGPQLLPRTRVSVYATKYRLLPGEDDDAAPADPSTLRHALTPFYNCGADGPTVAFGSDVTCPKCRALMARDGGRR